MSRDVRSGEAGRPVGPLSRAAVYLMGADTPLRLDENSVSRFVPPLEPGSGVVELIRGALYFLSEVRRTLTVHTPYVTAGVEGTEGLQLRDSAGFRPASFTGPCVYPVVPKPYSVFSPD